MSGSTAEPSGWLIAPCGTPLSYGWVLGQARNLVNNVGVTDAMLDAGLLDALAEMDAKAPNTSVTDISLTSNNCMGRGIYYANQDPTFLRPRLFYFRGQWVDDWEFVPSFSSDSYSGVIFFNSENINVPVVGETVRMWYERRNALAGMNGQYTTLHPAGLDVLACGTAFYAVLALYRARASNPSTQATARIHALGIFAKRLGQQFRNQIPALASIQGLQFKNWDYQGGQK